MSSDTVGYVLSYIYYAGFTTKLLLIVGNLPSIIIVVIILNVLYTAESEEPGLCS